MTFSASDVKRAAAECGVTPSAIRWRIRQGWPAVEVMGVMKPTLRRDMMRAAAVHGLTIRAIEQRYFEMGWSLEASLSEPRRRGGRPVSHVKS